MIYAVMGLFLIPFRRFPLRMLLLLAVLALTADYLVSISNKTFLVRDVIPRRVNPELEQQFERDKALAYDDLRDAGQRVQVAIKSGTYLDAVIARASSWKESNQHLFRYVWLPSFCMFLLGMYAGRRGLISSPPSRTALIRRVMWVALPLWLGLSALTTFGPQLLGPLYFKIHWKVLSVAWTLQGPAGSLFYVSAILSVLALRPGWIPKLAPLGFVGRMGLTNYLLQSAVGTLLFYGYGLNLQTRIGNLPGLMLGVTVFALQVPLSMWWLRRFQFGPMEWLWRSATYWHIQPLSLKKPDIRRQA